MLPDTIERGLISDDSNIYTRQMVGQSGIIYTWQVVGQSGIRIAAGCKHNLRHVPWALPMTGMPTSRPGMVTSVSFGVTGLKLS